MRRTMTKARILIAAVAATALGAVAIACTGSDGPAGAAGTPGATGAQGNPGAQGDAGPQGLPGIPTTIDGGISSSCLSPCHGFNGIVEQWKTSTHFATFIANLDGEEVASWTSPTASCGNCHAIDGIERRVASNVGVAGDGGIANVTTGEISYRNSTNNSVSEGMYTGTAKVAAVTCVTCHQVSDTNDPHRTGATYTPGSFPLRVATGPSDQVMLEKSPDKTAIVGTAAGTLGAANACIYCHKSRKDVTNYISGAPGADAGAANKLANTRWGPHEGPQADVYSGVGGYHFAGQTYDGQVATHRVKTTCVDCHMPTVTTNGNTPNHSFYAQLSACKTCHAAATNFDVNGAMSEVKAAMFELEAALNAAGYITRSSAAPYEGLTSDQLKDGAFELDLTRPNGSPDGGVPVLTADQAGALYNYLIIARGGALGVHNPRYVRQLIFDSYKAITGNAPTKIVRP